MRHASESGIPRLTREIQHLRNFYSDPFAIFIAEALRYYGGAVPDPPPAEESAAALGSALAAYQDAVAEAQPFTDLLGPIYMEFIGTSKQQWGGMFYTPWTISVATSRLIRGGWEPRPKAAGELWRMQEPACGCGALVLAWLATLVEDFGPGALHLWNIQAIDKDLTAARACALQVIATLAHQVWGIGELQVLHGDTLRHEFYACLWHSRLQPYVGLLDALVSGADAAAQAATEHATHPAVQSIPPVPPVEVARSDSRKAAPPARRVGQLDMFEEAA